MMEHDRESRCGREPIKKIRSAISMDMKTEPAEYREISIRGSNLFIIPVFDYIPYISSLVFVLELSCARKIIKLKKKMANKVFS